MRGENNKEREPFLLEKVLFDGLLTQAYTILHFGSSGRFQMSGQEPQELGVHVSELYNQIQQLQAQVRQAQTQADKAQKEAQAAKFQQTTSAQPSFTIKPPKPDIFEG